VSYQKDDVKEVFYKCGDVSTQDIRNLDRAQQQKGILASECQ